VRPPKLLELFPHWWQRHLDFILFFFLAAATKFINLRTVLYFIWDQGRDAWAIRNIVVNHDLVLVGPTSGMQGFFLGPLWFYAGVPGYILGHGSPYILSAWYIAIACSMLIFVWWLTHKLFAKPTVATAAAYLVAFLPGALAGTTFIWNPLLSLPLVAAATWALIQSRQSRWWMTLGFFLFALVLQSEFAYAVFFLVPLWLLIPWLRQRWDVRDFLLATGAVAVTLVPQGLFELRHNWLMTNAIINSFHDSTQSIGWGPLWQTRPGQLWDATRRLLAGGFPAGNVLTLLLMIIVGWAIWRIWRRPANFAWRLISLLAIVPYVGFMLWRGNHGYFFLYYYTPHFIFLGLLIAYGVEQLSAVLTTHHLPQSIRALQPYLVPGLLGMLATVCVATTWSSTIDVENNAGLRTMESALSTVYAWTKTDDVPQQQAALRIFTPNAQTEHYDYIMHWLAQNNRMPIPRTVRTASDQTWYTILEPDPYAHGETRFFPWYKDATASGVLVRRMKVGALYLETWMSPAAVKQHGYSALPFTVPRVALE
jgi:hypothetical protein